MRVDSPQELGTTLRSRRNELGLSQEEVAAVVGVNRRVIGELEHGKPTVQLQIALEVSRALGLDLDLRARR